MRQAITQLGVYAASPFAFLVVLVYVALWGFSRVGNIGLARRGDDCHLVYDSCYTTC